MVIDRIPTANESPDTTNGIAGDVAVTTPTNTDHASTTSTATGDGNHSQVKSCRWSAFQNLLVGNRTSVKLKVTHTSSGSTTDSFTDTFNQFQLEYSLNGGGSWNSIVNRINFTASQGPTEAVITLPLTQDLTQVQVRDIITAVESFPAIAQTVTAVATISGIKVEVTVADATLLD